MNPNQYRVWSQNKKDGHTKPFFPLFFLYLGEDHHTWRYSVFRVYPRLCTLGSLLAALGNLWEMVGIEPWSAACQESTLPVLLIALAPTIHYFSMSMKIALETA